MIQWPRTSGNSGNTPMRRCTTFMRTFKHCVKYLWICVSLRCSLWAQLKPPVDSWPTYPGDYSGQRHSLLKQITPSNVSQLSQVWKFQTGQNQQIKATSILVNGIIYVSTPDNL